MALAIAGHHLGLDKPDKDALRALAPGKDHPVQGLRFSDESWERLRDRLQNDGLELPPSLDASIYSGINAPAAAAMLDVRMLFSCLVDADFLETEAHFKDSDLHGPTRPPAPALQPAAALERLLEHLRVLAQEGRASAEMLQVRQDLLQACLEAAQERPGLFTLSAPTGAGKTLALLAFALAHAARHGLRRVVVVIPYLSIIEQTAAVFREVLAPLLEPEVLPRYLLEDHSLAGFAREGQQDGDDQAPGPERLLAQNWDAPLVITTNVQMMQSLFANRPAACRKLHRLAESVLLFDEAQTWPAKLAVPTLAALSHLAKRYGSSLVLSTATQPAFGHLQPEVRKLGGHGWQPREIAHPELRLFPRSRRVAVKWPQAPLRFEDLAHDLAGQKRALVIVNLKRQALELFQHLENLGAQGLFHLSTNMCPAHRQAVLAQVRLRLEDADQPCLLVSTQCVEAGVDLDFPQVWRAWGPLEAMAQAAGRCNRGGRMEQGQVRIFTPHDEGFPDGAYRQAADVTRIMFKELGAEAMDLNDPQLFTRYYQRLYDLARPQNLNPDLTDAIKCQNFPATAENYRLIERNAINVLVGYDVSAYEALAERVREEGLSAAWMAQARPHTVSLFRPGDKAPLRAYLEPAPLAARRGKGAEQSQDWFIHLRPKHYHPKKGLETPQGQECLIG
jgi:CRISPR-associated helicase Cas3